MAEFGFSRRVSPQAQKGGSASLTGRGSAGSGAQRPGTPQGRPPMPVQARPPMQAHSQGPRQVPSHFSGAATGPAVVPATRPAAFGRPTAQAPAQAPEVTVTASAPVPVHASAPAAAAAAAAPTPAAAAAAAAAAGPDPAIVTMQGALARHQAAVVALMQKVEEQAKRLQEAEALVKAADTTAKAAKDSATRFFGQVNVPRLLGFNTIPADSQVREDLACVQAQQGDWLPMAYPVVYVSRTDPATSSTVSDAWLRTFSIDTATLQVQEYWVRALGEDGKTPSFSRCSFHLPTA